MYDKTGDRVISANRAEHGITRGVMSAVQREEATRTRALIRTAVTTAKKEILEALTPIRTKSVAGRTGAGSKKRKASAADAPGGNRPRFRN